MLLAEHEPTGSGGGWPTSTKPPSTPSCHEATRLAGTVQTWWPAILVALTEGRRQRPHRRLQPDHQTGQTRRLRLPQHDQLPTPYPEPHRGHPTDQVLDKVKRKRNSLSAPLAAFFRMPHRGVPDHRLRRNANDGMKKYSPPRHM